MWVIGKGDGAAHGGGSGGGSSLTVEMIAVSIEVSGAAARRQEGGVALVEGWKRMETNGWVEKGRVRWWLRWRERRSYDGRRSEIR
jgi:hypothetical protein